MTTRGGTTKKRSKLPVVETYSGKLVKRVEQRARICIDSTVGFDGLDLKVGVRLIVDALYLGGEFEVVAADVYATHPAQRFVDVHLKAPLSPDARIVEIKRSAFGEVA